MAAVQQPTCFAELIDNQMDPVSLASLAMCYNQVTAFFLHWESTQIVYNIQIVIARVALLDTL